MGTRSFEFRSRIQGRTQEELWAHASSWEGVNYELAPWVRMTFPARYAELSAIPADGRSHFRSILLAFGLLPFDAHRFALREIEAPAFFDEKSSNLLLRSWTHHRSVRPTDGGVEITDRCGLEPRVGLLAAPLAAVYRLIFAHRHRRLRRRFEEPERGR